MKQASFRFTSNFVISKTQRTSLSAITCVSKKDDCKKNVLDAVPVGSSPKLTLSAQAQEVMFARALPRVLIVHTGGTLGMDPVRSYEVDVDGHQTLKTGTGGEYEKTLRPGNLLRNLLVAVPELSTLARIDLQVAANKDSSNMGPQDWIKIARLMDKNRDKFDAFLVVCGTDTMAFIAAALSLMLCGFRKPIVLTGSQIPLALPRSDARQNLIDSLTCAVAQHYPPHVALQEVCICFGGRLFRGNRAQKQHTATYQAFASLSYPPLAQLGVDVEWNRSALLHVEGVYRPRFELDPRVLRVPIIPGTDPTISYGDLHGRGVRGCVLEAFGVGNMPDKGQWMSWLRDQRKKGLLVYLRSQSSLGPLAPQLYKSGSAALKLGVEAGPQMTPECASVKLMLCLKYRDLPMGMPLAGEM